MKMVNEIVITSKFNPWYYNVDGKLVKKLKPCMPGQYVHITPRQGQYLVLDVKMDYFVIQHAIPVKLTWDKFHCVHGQGKSYETMLKKQLRANLAVMEAFTIQVTNQLKELRK